MEVALARTVPKFGPSLAGDGGCCSLVLVAVGYCCLCCPLLYIGADWCPLPPIAARSASPLQKIRSYV